LIFIDLEGDSNKVQIMATAAQYKDEGFEELSVKIKRGDILGVVG